MKSGRHKATSVRENILETYSQTYPKVDAIVDEYLHLNEFHLRSSDEGEYILLKEKEESVVQYHELSSREMIVLDNEDKATYIIHKLMYSNALKRGILLFIPFLFIIATAVYIFMNFGVGVAPTDNYLAAIAYCIACIGLSIIPLTSIFRQEQRRADLSVLAIRQNLVDVFETIAEVQVSERQRQSYLERAQMLKQQRQEGLR